MKKAELVQEILDATDVFASDQVIVDTETFDAEKVRQIVKDELDSHNRSIVIEKLPENTFKNMGMQHYQFETILKLVSARLDIFLAGPAGSGKTTCACKVAEALGIPFYMMAVGKMTTKSDIFGYCDATGKYNRSLFREAYENGGVFLMDEIDAGHPNTLTGINAMLDNGIGAFPDQMIDRHEDFVFVASGNTYGTGADRQYVGRNAIDGATRNRFAFIDFGYDEALESAISTDSDWTRYVQSIRAAVNELGEKILVTPRASIKGSKLLATNSFEWDELTEMLIFQGADSNIKTRVLDRATTIYTRKTKKHLSK